MEILRARPADARTLSAIAYAAKAYWGYSAAQLACWGQQLIVTPAYIRNHEVFLGRFDARSIAFYALVLSPADQIMLDHLWVLPEAIGRGVGRALFRHAAERARLLGATTLTIEADPNAEHFYRKMGAVRAGTNLSEVEGQHRELPVLRLTL